MGRVIEPLVAPLITRVNTQLGWKLVLYPHWRPVFLLMMVPIIGPARVLRVMGYTPQAVVLLVIVIPCLLTGALIAGLLPLEGRLWELALLVLAPIIWCCAGLVLMFLIEKVWGALDDTYILDEESQFALGGFNDNSYTVFCFVNAHCPSWSASTANLGESQLWDTYACDHCSLRWRAFHDGGWGNKRIGLSILSGFFLAGMVVVADALIKAAI
jgi:hypothetical protein